MFTMHALWHFIVLINETSAFRIITIHRVGKTMLVFLIVTLCGLVRKIPRFRRNIQSSGLKMETRASAVIYCALWTFTGCSEISLKSTVNSPLILTSDVRFSQSAPFHRCGKSRGRFRMNFHVITPNSVI
jgi:hypothetical protein